MESDGFVVEDGRQIETNVHVFADENRKLLNSLPSCTFATKVSPSHTFRLMLKEGYYKFGTTKPNSDRANDFAFVRLDGMVESVEPLKFGRPPMPGETVYMVSTTANYASKRLDPSQLIARTCVNIHTYSGNSNTNSSFLNDCDNVGGDSSALYFARRGGNLEAVGLHESGGREAANGLDFDIATKDPNKGSYGMGLGFDDKMLSMSADLAKTAAERSNARLGHKTNSASSKGH
jgi:hypothetical protein